VEHFASFPQLNPNPVLEIDHNGNITYCNRATVKALKNMHCSDEVTVFLPDDIGAIVKHLAAGREQTLYREVKIKQKIFAENIHLTSQFGTVRIYARDITRHKQTNWKKGWRKEPGSFLS
jgi:PAS domain-containing protein